MIAQQTTRPNGAGRTPAPQLPTRPRGRTGLVQHSGYIHEERIKEFRGRRYADLLREMLDSDPDVITLRNLVEWLLRQVQRTLVPADESEAATEVATFVESCFDDMDDPWTMVLCEILTHLWWGWSAVEVTYKHRDGDEPDPTRRSKHEDGKVGWRAWGLRAQETLEHWQFDDEGTATGFVQVPAPTYQAIEIPLDRCLHFRTTSHKGNPEGRSTLRGCVRPYYFKTNIQAVEAIGIERDLAGVPVMEVPAAIMASDASAADKALYAACQTIVTNLKRDEQEGVIMPLSYDPETKQPLYKLSLLSTGGQRQFDTNTVILRYSREIVQVFLADFIKLGHEKVGSFALSSDKTNLFSVALGAWLDGVAAVINDHAIPRLLRFNGIALTLRPALKFGDVEKPDTAGLVASIKTLVDAGMEVFPNPQITKFLLEVLGLPAPSLEELEAQAEEQQAQADAMQQALAAGKGQPGQAGGPAGEGGQGRPGARARQRPPARASEDEPDDEDGLLFYDPHQPRVPKGSPAGGQWGGVGPATGPVDAGAFGKLRMQQVMHVVGRGPVRQVRAGTLDVEGLRALYNSKVPPPPPSPAAKKTPGAAPAGPTNEPFVDLSGKNPPADWERHWTGWAGQLTAGEQQAVRAYTGTGYLAINRGLRKSPPPPAARTLAQIDSALGKGQLDRNTTLFRGLSVDLSHLQAGQTFSDNGYVSTSLHSQTAVNFTGFDKGSLIQIRARRGQRGAYVDDLSQQRGEREFLLPRGTHFRVVSVQKATRTRRRPIIVVDIVAA